MLPIGPSWYANSWTTWLNVRNQLQLDSFNKTIFNMSHNTYFCHIRFYCKFDFMSKLKQKFSVFSKSTQMSFRPSRIEVTTFLIESICHKNNLSNKLQWLPRPLKCFFFSFLFIGFKKTHLETQVHLECVCVSVSSLHFLYPLATFLVS